MHTMLNSLKVEYQLRGKGKTVVLLHGWGVHSQNLQNQIDYFSKTNQVLAIDFPGFGKSSQPKEVWGVGEYANMVTKLINQLGINEIEVIAGHSFGGRVAIKGLSEGVLRAKKLVLIGSAGVRHSSSVRNKTLKLFAKTGKAVFALPGLSKFSKKARAQLYKKVGSTDYIDAGAMKDTFTKVINEDLSENATRITIPTLLIWGSDDYEAPLADARYFHRAIENSQLKIVQGAGHFVHNEHPRKVNQWIEAFISSSK